MNDDANRKTKIKVKKKSNYNERVEGRADERTNWKEVKHEDELEFTNRLMLKTDHRHYIDYNRNQLIIEPNPDGTESTITLPSIILITSVTITIGDGRTGEGGNN